MTVARPVRAEVAATYDRGVDAYVNVWSAVIQPPARAVVAALGLPPAATVVDIGGGTGALVRAIREAARDGTVVAIDASLEMLRANRARTDAKVAHADALALPLRDDSVDAALMAFVLFHLSDPHTALVEAARVLRAGGTIGTVTWSSEASVGAFNVWDMTLTEAGAPGLAPRRVDTGLDSCDAIEATLTTAGFRPQKIWQVPLEHQWTPQTYWQLATGSGLNRLRLDALDDAARAETLARVRQRLEALEPDQYAWHGEVVCAVATR